MRRTTVLRIARRRVLRRHGCDRVRHGHSARAVRGYAKRNADGQHKRGPSGQREWLRAAPRDTAVAWEGPAPFGARRPRMVAHSRSVTIVVRLHGRRSFVCRFR